MEQGRRRCQPRDTSRRAGLHDEACVEAVRRAPPRSGAAEVKEAQRLYNLCTFGPSGIFEQDDGENWSEVQKISHGFITNGVPLNYQMGIGRDVEDGLHPGTTSELYSDSAGRAFYAAWHAKMNTPAWHES